MHSKYLHGNVLMVDYTALNATEAGSVIVIGDKPYIAHSDIPLGELGALAAVGGVYEVTAGGALAAGDKVGWNPATKKVQATGLCFGFVCPDESAAADGDVIRVEHAPDGTTLV
ncbi:MAG: DUF2190 family protein [Planctomycetaceae bacterium]